MVSSYCNLIHSRNIMNKFFSCCIMQIIFWVVSALLKVRACFNHLREDLTDTEADLLNIGVLYSVAFRRAVFQSKIFSFLLFLLAVLFHTFNTADMTKSQCLEKERLHQTKTIFKRLCLLHCHTFSGQFLTGTLMLNNYI